MLLTGEDGFAIELAEALSAEGLKIFLGGHVMEMLSLVAVVRRAGGEVSGRTMNRKSEAEITTFIEDAERHGPLRVCIVDLCGNDRSSDDAEDSTGFCDEWAMKCRLGFLACRESARLMIPRKKGCIIFVTRSMKANVTGLSAGSLSSRFAMRGAAQAAAMELMSDNIHVNHFVMSDFFTPQNERLSRSHREFFVRPELGVQACIDACRTACIEDLRFSSIETNIPSGE